MARRLFSVVYAGELFWTWVVKVRWLLLRGHAVICDRYVADALVDFAVLSATDVASPPAALRVLRALAPRPRVAFLLDVIEGEALARKPEEGSADHLAEARRAFKTLAARSGMTVLPAHLSQEQVYEAVAHETLAPFYLRYRTFINWIYLSNPGQMNPKAWRAKTVYHQNGVSAP
jgi:thymidylate kinase